MQCGPLASIDASTQANDVQTLLLSNVSRFDISKGSKRFGAGANGLSTCDQFSSRISRGGSLRVSTMPSIFVEQTDRCDEWTQHHATKEHADSLNDDNS
jgi:hypothetical protein